MNRRDTAIYAAAGLAIWLNGAVAVRLGGRSVFADGPIVVAIIAASVAVLVCLAYRSTMAWRKASTKDAVTIAVVMALPGLAAETVRQTVFTWATGLPVTTAPSFAAVIIFGNAALLTYAVLVGWRSDAI